MSCESGIKGLVMRSKLLTIVAAIVTNYYIGFMTFTGLRKISRSSRTKSSLDTKNAIGEARTTFNIFVSYGLNKISDLKNKEVLEIGTGNNLLVPLMFLAAGAKKVVTIDKFYCLRSNEEQRILYEQYFRNCSGSERKNIDRVLRFGKASFKLDKRKLEYVPDTGMENYSNKASFDYVVSSSVLEHVQDLDKAFMNIRGLLRKGGKLLSYVAWSDHGLFSFYHDPEYFLRIPKPLWTMMTNKCGRVNRQHINTYRNLLRAHGFTGRIFIAKIKGQPEFKKYPLKLERNKHYTQKYENRLSEKQRSFTKEFRNISIQDLMTERIFIDARKN